MEGSEGAQAPEGEQTSPDLSSLSLSQGGEERDKTNEQRVGEEVRADEDPKEKEKEKEKEETEGQNLKEGKEVFPEAPAGTGPGGKAGPPAKGAGPRGVSRPALAIPSRPEEGGGPRLPGALQQSPRRGMGGSVSLGGHLLPASMPSPSFVGQEEEPNMMRYECPMEVKLEALPSRKIKEKDWKLMTLVLEGQQISLYPEGITPPRTPRGTLTKSSSMVDVPSAEEAWSGPDAQEFDSQESRALDKEKEQEQEQEPSMPSSASPIVRSSSFGGTVNTLEATEALKRISRTSATSHADDDVFLARVASIRSNRSQSMDALMSIDEARPRSKSELFSLSAKAALMNPPSRAPEADPEYVIGLTGSKLHNLEDKTKKVFQFKIESEWDGTFLFKTVSQTDYNHLLKELRTALEWSNKASSVDDKGLARTSHCIPHRFTTENMLLKRCRFCGKIITEFKGYRCIHCGDCFHTKCGKYAPPNCGLSSMKDALSSIQVEAKSIRKVTDTLSSRLKNKGDNIFGVELHLQPPTVDGIPTIVKLCINAVEQRGMDSIGIYRVSGIKSEIERLRVYFSFGRPNLIDDEQWNDVNVVTGVLKAWFRELPTPLMTFDLFDEFMALPKKNKVNTAQLQQVLAKLPQQNYAILKYLMGHLHRVAKLSEQNKMQPENLAALFGPNLLRSKDEKGSDVHTQIALMRHMIVEYQSVFESSA